MINEEDSQMSFAPKTLNGYTVVSVAAGPHPESYYLVLVNRPEHPYHKWVVATWFRGDTWSNGHYYENRLDAETHWGTDVTWQSNL